MGKAFEMMMAGLEDAIAYSQGDTTRGRVVHPVDPKAIREATSLTQEQFAEAYRLPIGTVRDWEQRRTRPDSGARMYLRMIETDPRTVREMVAKVEA